MHVNREFILVVERCLTNKGKMLGRYRARKRLPHLFEVLLSIYAQWLARILLKGLFSAGHRRQPEIADSFKKVHQHFLVITSQANNSFGVLAAKLRDVCYAT